MHIFPLISLLMTTLVAMTSCHISGTSYDADSEKGYAEAIKHIQKNVDLTDCKIYYMEFETSQPQGNKVETVTIKYVNTNDKAYSQKMLVMGAQVVRDPEPIAPTFESPVYKDVKGIDLATFDSKKIADQIAQAKKLIPKDGKYMSVYNYKIEESVPAGNEDFNSDYVKGKQSTSFQLFFSQKTPDGKPAIAEVRVIVDDNGKVKFDI